MTYYIAEGCDDCRESVTMGRNGYAYVQDRLVGEISETEEGCMFKYDEEYLQSDEQY